MVILGLDYGRSRIGVALSDGFLAEPLSVIKTSSPKEAIEKIGKVSKDEGAEKLVVGISEGNMAQEEKQFAQKLSEELKIPVETWDETLTTQDAHSLALKAGIPRKKRKSLEDAFAATVMLQSYLDDSAVRDIKI